MIHFIIVRVGMLYKFYTRYLFFKRLIWLNSHIVGHDVRHRFSAKKYVVSRGQVFRTYVCPIITECKKTLTLILNLFKIKFWQNRIFQQNITIFYRMIIILLSCCNSKIINRRKLKLSPMAYIIIIFYKNNF